VPQRSWLDAVTLEEGIDIGPHHPEVLQGSGPRAVCLGGCVEDMSLLDDRDRHVLLVSGRAFEY
jgi:hypothetical protein